MRLFTTACAGLLLAGLTAPAHAFHLSNSFEVSANEGGGGGIFFTGAARWKRYDCAICHVGKNGGVTVGLTSSPPELFTRGEWEPNRTYEIVVEMLGESRGFASGVNFNTFVAELSDGAGQPLRSFDFDPAELDTWNDGQVIGARGDPDRTRWSFRFTAPSAGAGALSLDIAMVDGNGAGTSSGRASDLRGDGVATAHRSLCEVGAACGSASDEPGEPGDAAVAGCSATSGGASWMFAALLLLLIRRRAPLPCYKNAEAIDDKRSYEEFAPTCPPQDDPEARGCRRRGSRSAHVPHGVR